MATLTGPELAHRISLKVEELKKVCAGVDDDTAARAPAGRWSPMEILSHLRGPEGVGHLAMLLPFLGEEPATIEITPGNPFFTEQRARMHFVQLLSEVDKKFEDIANFAASLTPEQLGRTAHVPLLKDSPLGEYPTLGGLILGLGEYHVQFHIDQMRETLRDLAAA
jgi:hypothetical protein